MPPYTRKVRLDELAKREASADVEDDITLSMLAKRMAEGIRGALRAQAQRAAAERDEAPLPAQPTATLVAAFRSAIADGADLLATRAADAGLDYDVARLTSDYLRQADAWERALAKFRPTPPLTQRTAGALIAQLDRLVEQDLVGGLIEQAEAQRLRAQNEAAQWLNRWHLAANHIPEDEAERDAYEARQLARLVRDGDRDPDAPTPPDDTDTFETELVAVGTDVATGQPVYARRINYRVRPDEGA